MIRRQFGLRRQPSGPSRRHMQAHPSACQGRRAVSDTRWVARTSQYLQPSLGKVTRDVRLHDWRGGTNREWLDHACCDVQVDMLQASIRNSLAVSPGKQGRGGPERIGHKLQAHPQCCLRLRAATWVGTKQNCPLEVLFLSPAIASDV